MELDNPAVLLGVEGEEFEGVDVKGEKWGGWVGGWVGGLNAAALDYLNIQGGWVGGWEVGTVELDDAAVVLGVEGEEFERVDVKGEKGFDSMLFSLQPLVERRKRTLEECLGGWVGGWMKRGDEEGFDSVLFSLEPFVERGKLVGEVGLGGLGRGGEGGLNEVLDLIGMGGRVGGKGVWMSCCWTLWVGGWVGGLPCARRP